MTKIGLEDLQKAAEKAQSVLTALDSLTSGYTDANTLALVDSKRLKATLLSVTDIIDVAQSFTPAKKRTRRTAAQIAADEAKLKPVGLLGEEAKPVPTPSTPEKKAPPTVKPEALKAPVTPAVTKSATSKTAKPKKAAPAPAPKVEEEEDPFAEPDGSDKPSSDLSDEERQEDLFDS